MENAARYILLSGLLCVAGFTSCEISPSQPETLVTDTLFKTAALKENGPAPDSALQSSFRQRSTDSNLVINTGNTKPEELMRFAESLIGTPYVWASADPQVGFDCSGFITYVFSRFNISVPRSSIDFFNVGKTVPLAEAKRGDFILFTGTDSLETDIGHMGLVVANNSSGLSFIHSTSGKAMGVTVSPLNEQYKRRFVRVSRIF